MKIYFESILIAAGFVLIIFAMLLHGPHDRFRQLNHTSQATQSSVLPNSRVEFYKRQIGDRLNSQRLNAQYENLGAKKAAGKKFKAEDDNVLHGVPLEGEQHPFAKMEKPPQEKPSVEGEINGYVAFERNLRSWEENARKQYIAEFMARAESMGYHVEIDKNYNVYYEYIGGERAPQSTTLDVPLSILAPRCQL